MDKAIHTGKKPGAPVQGPPLSKDTSRPGREEEVIDQHEENHDSTSTVNTEKQSPATGERRYREGLADNDNKEQDNGQSQ